MGSILSCGGIEGAIGIMRLISQYLPCSFTCTSLCVQLPYSRLVFLPFFLRYAGSLHAQSWFVGFVHPEGTSKCVIVEFPRSIAKCAHVCGGAPESVVKISFCNACSSWTTTSIETVRSSWAETEINQVQPSVSGDLSQASLVGQGIGPLRSNTDK